MERGSIHLGLESFWRVIGDGTEEDRLTPVEVKGLSGIVDISAGHYKSMALDSSGYPWVWGMDTPGMLGMVQHARRPQSWHPLLTTYKKPSKRIWKYECVYCERGWLCLELGKRVSGQL